MNQPINSQGTMIYVVDIPATEWTDCSEAATAIQAGKQVLCPQSLGELEQVRTVTEYKCLSSNDSTKIAGAISRGTLDIGMLFDPTDVDGQAAMEQHFADNTPFRIGIEYPDKDVSLGTNGGNGSIRWFNAIASREAEAVELDAAIMYSITADIAGKITKCPMVAATA